MGKINNIKNQDGFIMVTTIVFMVISLALIYSYYSWVEIKTRQLDYRIANAKAFYNAEAGIAFDGYANLISASIEADTTLNINEKLSREYDGSRINMGNYYEPSVQFDQSDIGILRIAKVIGKATANSPRSQSVDVEKISYLIGRLPSLGKYFYFTDSENAGGAPFSFGPPGFSANQRREVYFYNQDEIQGVIQSNNTPIRFSSSAFGCPDFSDATFYLTYGFPEPDWGSCNGWTSLFQHSPDQQDTQSVCKLMFPPPGYYTLKDKYNFKFDSGIKINTAAKDTLIMTDIEFHSDGRFRVVRWWYLMPPHLKSGISDEAIASPYPQHLDGGPNSGWNENSFEGFCRDPYNIMSCKPYLDSLRAYHARGHSSYNQLGVQPDIIMDPTIAGPHGFSHYDIPKEEISKLIMNSGDGCTAECEDAVILDEEFYAPANAVIYVKDGPVRVHGTYKGRYTVVTDEYTTYRRHAWNDSIASAFSLATPIDTIWNNIWITDDLVNVDQNNSGSLINVQPNDDCEGGSRNSMGLVSGANIIIANTEANGGGNGGTSGSSYGDSGVRIHAGMIALNESFVAHYWQNSTNTNSDGSVATGYNPPSNWNYGSAWDDITDSFALTTGANAASQRTHYPPWGDARGRQKAQDDGGNPSTTMDQRGAIVLWGGVIQRYRGYVQRNASSPYGYATLGYQIKDYNYDANLRCTPPPYYPTIACEGSDELEVELLRAYTKKYESDGN